MSHFYAEVKTHDGNSRTTAWRDNRGQVFEDIDNQLDRLNISHTSSNVIGGNFMTLVQFHSNKLLVAEALIKRVEP